MSENFDKEAEREKLKEKYEHDKEKRQATEQMSELLLQGATMTNAHCSECGDPIFRYEGQEFCPTCEKPVDRGGEEAEDGEDEADDSDNIQVTTPSDDARVSFGQQSDQSQGDEQPPAEEVNGQQPNQPAAAQQSPAENPRRISETVEQSRTQQSAPQQNQSAESNAAADQQRQPSRTGQQPSGTGPATAGEASVSAARESLVAALTRFSQQAAATDDPKRAQEHLAAAREAAEALAALRQ
ncbi:Sjogren's syndrome/scleroderma autoantigen 1 family protein [Halovenus sp. HT40]|uniref:Sjogren's syndrome/scleroderma autoantigen 1 family protein n=1 Tax=Halovenus sp. HT40 TaxID=3126691 RepID=UPI00300EF0CD